MSCGCDTDILSQLARATNCGQAPTMQSVAQVMSSLCKECVWLVPAATPVSEFMDQLTTPANLSCDCDFYLVAVGASIANPDDLYITADTPAPADTSWKRMTDLECTLPIASGETPDSDATNGIASANYNARVAAGCTHILFYSVDSTEIWVHNTNDAGNPAFDLSLLNYEQPMILGLATRHDSSSALTTSATFTVLGGMTVTFTPETTNCLIVFSGHFTTSDPGEITFFHDGVNIFAAPAYYQARGGGTGDPQQMTIVYRYTALNAGVSNTVDLRFRRTSGSNSGLGLGAGSAQLMIVQLRDQ